MPSRAASTATTAAIAAAITTATIASPRRPRVQVGISARFQFQPVRRRAVTPHDGNDKDSQIDWKVGPSKAQVRACDREIVALAWPAVMSALIDPVLSLVDTYWVSSCLGTIPLAALGPALNIEDWLFEILKTVQVPVRSLTARAMAVGDKDSVAWALAKALCLCWRVGLAVAFVGSFLAPWLLRLSAVDGTSPLFLPARDYLVPRLVGTPFLLTLIVLQAVLAGAFRDLRASFQPLLLVALVNPVLPPAFIVSLVAGTGGAAWATTAACCASAVAAWRVVDRRGAGNFRWLPRPQALLKRVFLGGTDIKGSENSSWIELLRANAAMSVRTCASISTWLVACALITKQGVVPIAAHLCMMKMFLFLLFILYGFQLATQVLVSAHVANGDSRRGRWTAMRAIRMSSSVAAANAVFLMLGKGWIANMLGLDPSVAAFYGDLALPAAAMLLMYGVSWVVDGVLYGLADFVWLACWHSVAAIAAICIMLTSVTSAQGIWWCLNLMTAIRLVAVVHRAFFAKQSPLKLQPVS